MFRTQTIAQARSNHHVNFSIIIIWIITKFFSQYAIQWRRQWLNFIKQSRILNAFFQVRLSEIIYFFHGFHVYLNKFASLIRIILSNSKKDVVPFAVMYFY